MARRTLCTGPSRPFRTRPSGRRARHRVQLAVLGVEERFGVPGFHPSRSLPSRVSSMTSVLVLPISLCRGAAGRPDARCRDASTCQCRSAAARRSSCRPAARTDSTRRCARGSTRRRSAAIGGPHRRLVVAGADGLPLQALRLPVVDPDVALTRSVAVYARRVPSGENRGPLQTDDSGRSGVSRCSRSARGSARCP